MTKKLEDRNYLYPDTELELTTVKIPKKMNVAIKKLADKKNYSLSELILRSVDIQLRLEKKEK